jgi:topoisomerase-4 subunit A
MAETLIPDGGGIEDVDLKAALEERYLAYALSTIMHRALPDVRDGLKPVHRRILFGMRQLRLDPGTPFKKSARVVGDVMGKFHPHGDQAIYDAIVRLAQAFAVRYPLVDGQGNFGTIDGDGAAAMRYTEARMTDVAGLILEGLDEDAVDFRETYDGLDQEPVVMPGSFPNLLANGASGIAVGMATNVPPHNVAELAEAALHLIKHPDAATETLVKMVPGPDFPTGGVIVEDPASLLECYRTGRGGVRVRARWEKEDLGRGTWQIVVTEIPYMVQKGRLVERIADLLQLKKLPLLDDVRDESAEDIRLVLEPRSKTVDPEMLMQSIFRLTDLESRVPVNMNVLMGGTVPKVVGLKEALKAWLDHLKDVLVRRSRHRLDKITRRLEILDGFLVVYLDLDRVIQIVREEDDPKAELIREFSLTDVQAEAILNMRLRSLRRLEEMEIRKEHTSLTEEKAGLEALLADDVAQWAKVSDKVKVLRETFGQKTELGRRRTTFATASVLTGDIVIEAMIEREPITVVVSEKGWIRALKGHLQDVSQIAFKQDDRLSRVLHAETTDKLLIVSTGGRFYTIGADKLPGGRGHGEPIRLMVDMEQGHDVVDVMVHVPDRTLLVASTAGRGFLVAESEVVANTKRGKQILTVSGTEEAYRIVDAGGDTVAVLGENRKLLLFPKAQIPQMTKGRGVRLQRYKDGGLADLKVFAADDGLSWTDSSGRRHVRTMDEMRDWQGDRAQAGRLPPPKFPRGNRFDAS